MSEPSATVVWHELECGGYRADLELWRRLAASSRPGPILDVGAGSGRVCLELARAGYELVAVDRDRDLLTALRARAAGLTVETIVADARELALPGRCFALCIVPMQTVQLLGGARGRIGFFEAAQAHMCPASLLACAIVTDVEPYDWRAGNGSPSPEWTLRAGQLYATRAIRLERGEHTIEIERERRSGPAALHQTPIGARGAGPGAGALAEAVWSSLNDQRASVSYDLIALDRVTIAQLHEEAGSVGLTPLATLTVPATAEHSGSEVVVLRA